MVSCMIWGLAALFTVFHILMDGWMTCDFTSFSTVFQSYQDDGRMIMTVCNWTPFTVIMISSRAGIEPGQLDQ